MQVFIGARIEDSYEISCGAVQGMRFDGEHTFKVGSASRHDACGARKATTICTLIGRPIRVGEY